MHRADRTFVSMARSVVVSILGSEFMPKSERAVVPMPGSVIVPTLGNVIVTIALSVLFLVFSCGNAYAAASPQNNLDIQAIDGFIVQEMKAGNISGMSVGIVRNDQILYLKGFGTAGPGKGKVTPATAFVTGSVSKSFTGLAILQLTERGLLDLEDPVVKHLPWFAMGGVKYADSIRIVHLLNHTGGISAYAGNDSGVECSRILEERIRMKNNIRLKSPPGSRFEYASLNYDILGLIIEQITGQSYEAYVEANIFAPLAMTNTHASVEAAAANGLATGYRPWFFFLEPVDIDYPPSGLPSGYITSSAEDMTHYLMAFLNQGKYEGNAILSGEGITTAQSAIGDTGYGAGWYMRSYCKWHTGEVANYNASICTVPSHGLGIVTLSNTNDIGTKFLNREGSSLWRISEGLRTFLVGGQFPGAPLLNTIAMQRVAMAAVGVILFLAVALCIRSFASIRRVRKVLWLQGLKACVLAFAALGILVGVPVRIKGSWPALFVSVPDLTLSAVALSGLLLLSGVAAFVTVLRHAGRGKRIHAQAAAQKGVMP